MLDRILSRNMAALKSHRPSLLDRIRRLLDDEPESPYRVKLGTVPGGTAVRLELMRHDAPPRGRDGWLHGPYDALGEAGRQMEAIDWEHTGTVIQMGAGFGATARFLYDRFWKQNLREDRPRRYIIVEPEIHLLLEALANEDWTRLLSDPNVWFALGMPFDRLVDHPDISSFPACLWDKDLVVVAGTEMSLAEDTLRRKVEAQLQAIAEKTVESLKEEVREVAAMPRRVDIRSILLLSPDRLAMQKQMARVFQELGVTTHLVAYDDTSIVLHKAWIWTEYIRELKPDAIILINQTGRSLFGHDGLRELQLPIVSWFLDNPQRCALYRDFGPKQGRMVFGDSPSGERELVCCFDNAYLPWLKDQGFERVHHLPVGTGFTPTMGANSKAREGKVAFLGSPAVSYQSIRQFCLKTDAPELARTLNAVIDECEQDPSKSIWEEVSKILDDKKVLGKANLIRYVEDALTHRRRMKLLRAAQPHSLDVYGNLDWQNDAVESELTACYRGGPLAYTEEAPGLYANTDIILNLTHAQVIHGLPSSIFDVAACGGFVLSDRSENVEEIFDTAREIACFRSEEEMVDKIDYYLDHPDERHDMIGRAWEKIESSWTYHHILQKLLDLLKKGD